MRLCALGLGLWSPWPGTTSADLASYFTSLEKKEKLARVHAVGPLAGLGRELHCALVCLNPVDTSLK